MHGNNPRWCFYLLRTISKADHAGKSAVPGVDRKDLYDIFVPRPPIPEQVAIGHALDARLVEADGAVASVRHEIELIREYRTRLVADVVTGKLDVRAAAARLPEDEAEAAEPVEGDEEASDEEPADAEPELAEASADE